MHKTAAHAQDHGSLDRLNPWNLSACRSGSWIERTIARSDANAFAKALIAPTGLGDANSAIVGCFSVEEAVGFKLHFVDYTVGDPQYRWF